MWQEKARAQYSALYNDCKVKWLHPALAAKENDLARILYTLGLDSKKEGAPAPKALPFTDLNGKTEKQQRKKIERQIDMPSWATFDSEGDDDAPIEKEKRAKQVGSVRDRMKELLRRRRGMNDKTKKKSVPVRKIAK